MATPVSETIYASRDAIRTQVVDFLQQYMELNEVDLTQSSFLSYIIDILTTLSSNLMFYQSNIYREFFLTQAQLPESVHNLSSFLGYSPKEAKYATANVLMTVWLPFTDPNTIFTIPSEFKFQTDDDTTFVTFYETTVQIIENESVLISIENDGKLYDIPVFINSTEDPFYFQFLMPVRQYKTTIKDSTIDSDIELYQFIDKTFEFDGKLAGLTIRVRQKEDSTETEGELYAQYNSLYLMTSKNKGYVVRAAPGGRKIYFGNGIIGWQPEAGSTVIAYINETLGSDGNVIAGSITKGDRIYSQQKPDGEGVAVTTLVDYEVTNPSPAFGGEDEEDLQEIRNNSIKSLVSLGRLVSEQDYKNLDVIIPDAPIRSNSVPVLKRSDLKINEIQLFTIFKYGDVLVPSKNLFYTVPSGTSDIPRNTVIVEDQVEYITLFDMKLDSINEAAYYHYILFEAKLTPILIQTWKYSTQKIYHFHANEIIVTKSDTTSEATFSLSYFSNEFDFAKCKCELKIVSLDIIYEMENEPDPDSQSGVFLCKFDNYLDIPTGNQLIYFTVYTWEEHPEFIPDTDPPELNPRYIPEFIPGTDPPVSNPNYKIPFFQELAQYSGNVTFRKDLKSFMLSNTFVSTETTIYDIPVIQKYFYDSLDINNKRSFETEVLQQFLSVSEFKDYRMLTDFINLKLCNTTGKSKNMLRNSQTRVKVIDIGLTSIPLNPSITDNYVITGIEGGDWNGKRDKIAVCTSISPIIWSYIEPKTNDIIYIENKSSIYIYTEYGWIQPIYDIPLKLNIEVFKESDSSIGETDLLSSIKSAIIDYYKNEFGPKLVLRRSKIIDIIHNITGVSHCRLVTPESDIFFDYNIDEFTQQELLEYSPEWIYFTEDDITIKIFSLD